MTMAVVAAKIGFEHVATAFMHRYLGHTERWLEGDFLRDVPAGRTARAMTLARKTA